jgi:hypothetical protein
MDGQHNGRGWFDGLDVSIEIPLDGGDSGKAKANIRASTPALFALAIGAAVILDKGDALERLLNAVPRLAERFGDRLVAAT